MFSSSAQLFSDSLQEELSFLRERKIDFQKYKFEFSDSDRLTAVEKHDLSLLLRERKQNAQFFERLRLDYLKEQSKLKGLDAEQREKIETRLQEEEDRKADLRDREFARGTEQKNRTIVAAHLEIDENQEYNIRIPSKQDRAKARSPSKK